MEEIWKDIDGYDGYYQISNLGRVKSLRGRNQRILKQNKTKLGYMGISSSFNGSLKYFLVHRLVAIAFIRCKHEDYEVNHIDEDKANNFVENLEWVSHRRNINKSKNKRSKSKYPGVKFDERYNKWHSYCQINGRKKYLGSFDCEINAGNAYFNFCKDNNLKY